MAIDMDNLGGHLGEVLKERRDFTDPWGLPGFTFTGTVRRGDSIEWRQYEMDLLGNSPDQIKARELLNARIYQGLAPKGFRAPKKLSEGEAHQRMLGQMAQEQKLEVDTIALRRKKHGIAFLLCEKLALNGETVVKRAGRDYDLATPAGREAFFDHEIWTSAGPDGPVEMSVPLYKRGADGEVLLDEYDSPIEQEFGGHNFGDALAELVLSEANDVARFSQQRKAESLDVSSAASNGSSATGSPSLPQNDD